MACSNYALSSELRLKSWRPVHTTFTSKSWNVEKKEGPTFFFFMVLFPHFYNNAWGAKSSRFFVGVACNIIILTTVLFPCFISSFQLRPCPLDWRASLLDLWRLPQPFRYLLRNGSFCPAKTIRSPDVPENTEANCRLKIPGIQRAKQEKNVRVKNVFFSKRWNGGKNYVFGPDSITMSDFRTGPDPSGWKKRGLRNGGKSTNIYCSLSYHF